MSSTPTSAAEAVAAMGFREGQVVQELGWDDDVDEAVRNAIMDALDADLVDDALEAVDAVVLWWRQDDGDVADGLVDALRDLSETGHVWLLTPKVGRPGYVEPTDVAEGAVTAGLALANPVTLPGEWHAQKIVRPKAGRKA